MKIEILQNFIGSVDGKSVTFAIGEIADVPAADADHFIRGKYAKKVAPARRTTTKRPATKKGLSTKSLKK